MIEDADTDNRPPIEKITDRRATLFRSTAYSDEASRQSLPACVPVHSLATQHITFWMRQIREERLKSVAVLNVKGAVKQ